MSLAGLKRFVETVKAEPERLAAYGGLSAEELGPRLRADGFDVTDDEVMEAIRRGSELSDEQLDEVNGGALFLALVAGGIAGGVYAAGLLFGGAGLLIEHGIASLQGRQSQLQGIGQHLKELGKQRN